MFIYDSTYAFMFGVLSVFCSRDLAITPSSMTEKFKQCFLVQITRKLLQITSALLITNYDKVLLQITTAVFITNYDEVFTNCDTYSKLRQNYYKLPQVLQITTEHPQYKDSSYERVAVTLFRCVS